MKNICKRVLLQLILGESSNSETVVSQCEFKESSSELEAEKVDTWNNESEYSMEEITKIKEKKTKKIISEKEDGTDNKAE